MSIRKKPSAVGQNADSLTIVLISDTHELHREVEVPPGDILIHAGDFTMNSKRDVLAVWTRGGVL